MSASTPNQRSAAPASTGAGRQTTGTNSISQSSQSATVSSRSPSRMTSSQATAAGSSATTNGVSRTRSVRTGAPVSARAAAAARKQSYTPDPSEEDAKAEAQAKMDELQQKLQQAELSHDEALKRVVVLQLKLDESLKEQGILEDHVHEHTERINDLENEKKESLRTRREMEQIYELERAAVMKEKEEAATREEEMQQSMQRLKETLTQREMRAGLDDERRPIVSRHSSQGWSEISSPNPETSDRQFAPPSVQRSDSSSRSNSKLLLQKDKIIESLRIELAEAQIKLVEVENMGGGRMQELQKQLYDIKINNARLMEENESFQLLLSDKTMNGDFLRPHSGVSRPPSRSPDAAETAAPIGASLADELESHDESEGDDDVRRLRAENNSMRDQNKALTLYINNIISRLLQHEQFAEQILDKTSDLVAGPSAAGQGYREFENGKDLPPPPLEKDEQQGGLLQRAKSVLGGKSTRPRPLSQQVTPEPNEKPLPAPRLDEPSKHENPQTAPSVPIGRSSSRRSVAGHRRANSEWPAASVVTNMYRGPQSSLGGPLSPGLTSPSNRNSFFGRAPSSNSSVPRISESAAGKENFLSQRDSKIGSSGDHNSVISSGVGDVEGLENGQETPGSLAAERSNPSSPPRSTTSNDRDKGSGAIMMGSKPRPLRLVQEAAEEDQSKKLANRNSWFGWMNKGMPAPGGGGSVFGQRSNNGDSPAL